MSEVVSMESMDTLWVSCTTDRCNGVSFQVGHAWSQSIKRNCKTPEKLTPASVLTCHTAFNSLLVHNGIFQLQQRSVNDFIWMNQHAKKFADRSRYVRVINFLIHSTICGSSKNSLGQHSMLNSGSNFSNSFIPRSPWHYVLLFWCDNHPRTHIYAVYCIVEGSFISITVTDAPCIRYLPKIMFSRRKNISIMFPVNQNRA